MKKTYKIIFIMILLLSLQILFNNIVYGKADPILDVKVYIGGKPINNTNDVYEVGINDEIQIRAKADDGEGWQFTGLSQYSVSLDIKTDGKILEETENKGLSSSDIDETIGDGNDNIAKHVKYKAKGSGSQKINISAITKKLSGGVDSAENKVVASTTKEITIKVTDPIDKVLKEKAEEIKQLDIGGVKCIIDHTQDRNVFDKLVKDKISGVTGEITSIKKLVEENYYSPSSKVKKIDGFIGCKWYEGSLGTTFSQIDSKDEEKIKKAYYKQTGKELEIISDSLYQDTSYANVDGYGWMQIYKYKSKKLYKVIRSGKVSEDEVAYNACDMFIICKNEFEGAKPIYVIFTMLTEPLHYEKGEEIEFTEDDLNGIEDVNNNSSEMDNVTAKFNPVFKTVAGEDRDTYTDFKDVLNDTDNYIPTEEDPPEEFISMTSTVLTTITNVGMVISVLIIAILGLKYMLGSVEEKAEYKKDMIPYFVGACLLFGITTIVKILIQWGASINNI